MLIRLARNSTLLLLSAFSLSAIIPGCRKKSKVVLHSSSKYSRNQRYLFKFLDDYNSEYFSAKTRTQKDTLQELYSKRIADFLFDTLGAQIDSMNVTVDTVIQQGWMVTTQFHSREIEFKYGMTFKDSMEPRIDSFYQWMRSLKPQSQLIARFMFLGDLQLYHPFEYAGRTLRIFAYPEPLNIRSK